MGDARWGLHSGRCMVGMDQWVMHGGAGGGWGCTVGAAQWAMHGGCWGWGLQVAVQLPAPTLSSPPPQIYVSVPGSKKIILELPLVIGSRSGIGSRSSSMASQASSEMSWVDLNLPDAPEGEGWGPIGVRWGAVLGLGGREELTHPPSVCLAAPPCYLDIVPEDHRLESPTTPLLDDPDGFDSPIFMYAPEFKFMPPPTYTEVRGGLCVLLGGGGLRKKHCMGGSGGVVGSGVVG